MLVGGFCLLLRGKGGLGQLGQGELGLFLRVVGAFVAGRLLRGRHG